MLQRSFSAGQMNSVDLEMLSPSLTFRRQIFQKQNSQFSEAVFSFPRLYEYQANFALQVV